MGSPERPLGPLRSRGRAGFSVGGFPGETSCLMGRSVRSGQGSPQREAGLTPYAARAEPMVGEAQPLSRPWPLSDVTAEGRVQPETLFSAGSAVRAPSLLHTSMALSLDGQSAL